MRAKILIQFILSCMSVSAMAQNSAQETQFARELKEKYIDVRSIECNFVQTRSASVLTQNAEKRGEYYFLQPHNVLLAFEDGDYIKITSETLEIKQRDNITAAKVGSNPMLKSLNRMLTGCFSGNATQLTAGFEAEITATDHEYTLCLFPLRGKKVSETHLIFNRNDMSLKMMRITDASGDFIEYKFYDVKYNTDINQSIFDIR